VLTVLWGLPLAVGAVKRSSKHNHISRYTVVPGPASESALTQQLGSAGLTREMDGGPPYYRHCFSLIILHKI
jgi:hypothetical protein